MKTLWGIIKTFMLFGTIFLFFMLAGSCKTQRQATAIPAPVVVENITEQQDSIIEKHTEMEKEQTNTKEQTKESTTEKVTIVVNTEGDTIRTDREKTTVIDHWLMMENIRLQAKIDSLILNQNLKEKIEIPVPYPVEVKVEREFTAWEKFRLSAFWWLLGGLVFSTGIIFRKQLKNTAKNFLTKFF